MKYLILVLAVLSLAAQDPPPVPEAYPGQHAHALPPDGWFCERQNMTLTVRPEHACQCERMFDPDNPTVVREDRDCTVWCHADRCKCGISGKPPDAP